MSQHRYRQNKVKREHSIIEGLLPTLERIAEHAKVKSVTPGRIHPRSGAGRPGIRFQYVTESGLKFLARSSTAIQEVFVVTDDPGAVLNHLKESGIVSGNARRNQPQDAKRREAPAGPESKKQPSPPAGSRPRRRKGRTKAARPRGIEPQAKPAADTWNDVLRRHQRLLELEASLADADL